MELFISNKTELELLLDAEIVPWFMKEIPRLVAFEDAVLSSKDFGKVQLSLWCTSQNT